MWLIARSTALRSAAAATAAAALASTGGSCPFAQQHVSIPSVQLNTGAEMPRLGYGTYLANGDSLQQALLVAIRSGYRLIDTASGYMNERVVAAAMADSGLRRDEFFVTTKLWCDSHGTARTQRAIANSLRRLETEYIDLYLIHAPDNQGESAEEIQRLRRESWLAMEEAYRAGKLRAIGVSNFEPRHIEALLTEADGRPRKGAIVPAVNQIELHPFFDQRETRQYCAQRGIVVESYGAINADGLLEDPTLTRISRSYGRTPAQVSLRHTLQRGAVVLAKSLTPRRIEENAAVFRFSLDPEDVAALDRLDRGERSYWDNSDVP